MQQTTDFADGAAEIRTDHFGLDKGASYTIEWAAYPRATGGYYDFINQVRRDEGLNGRVEGAFSFVDRRKPPSRDFVDVRGLGYSSIACLSRPLDNPSLPLEGIEFVEFPKESAALKDTLSRTKAMYPGMKVMFHVAHSLYMCSDSERRWQDSRALGPDGKQLHYGPNSLAYYGRYIPEDLFGKGYRWWVFYPTPENSFGKSLIEAVDYMLNEIGATGMWADGFISHYAGRDGFSYDRWDGHSVTIDPKTKLVTAKKTCVAYVALPILRKMIRMIHAKGGVLITNGRPGPRSLWREPFINSGETSGSDAVPIGRMHLGRTVTPLGNHARSRTCGTSTATSSPSWTLERCTSGTAAPASRCARHWSSTCTRSRSRASTPAQCAGRNES